MLLFDPMRHRMLSLLGPHFCCLHFGLCLHGLARGCFVFPRPMEQVKAAYKKLSLQLHPDKNPDCKDCAAKFSKATPPPNSLPLPLL